MGKTACGEGSSIDNIIEILCVAVMASSLGVLGDEDCCSPLVFLIYFPHGNVLAEWIFLVTSTGWW